MKPISCIGLLLLAVALPVTAAKVYTWKDAEGRTHYSDSPPARTTGKTETKNLKGSTVQGDDLSYSTKVAMEKFPVILYTADCGEPCDKGSALLASRGVPYTNKRVATAEAQAELKTVTGGIGVPVLFVGKTKVTGFSESSWHGALDAAGYPRTVTRRPPTPSPSASPTPTPAAAPDASAASPAPTKP